MTKGIVTCRLNIRSGKPSVNAPVLGVYESGDEVEIADVVLGETKSDYYEGTPTWYKLSNGSYVWSGGVSMGLDEGVFNRKLSLDLEYKNDGTNLNQKSEVNYNTILESTNQFGFKGDGSKIRIAILDSGIDVRHNSLRKQLINNNENESLERYSDTHGTNLAALLVGDNEILRGVCKNAKIIDKKITTITSNVDNKKLLLALEKIERLNSENPKEKYCDIINLSLDVTDYGLNLIEPVIKKLYEQGIIINVAGGNGDSDSNKTRISTLTPYVYSIGAFYLHHFEIHNKNGFVNNNSVWFLNNRLKTFNLYPDYKEDFNNCSAYTAIFSGIVANYLSSNDVSFEKRHEGVNNLIKRCSTEIQKETNKEPINLKMYI